MAQTLDSYRFSYSHYFISPEATSLKEEVKLVVDHLLIFLQEVGSKRLVGVYERRGDEVLENNMPDWYRVPDIPTMLRFRARSGPELAPLAVLVSSISDPNVLRFHGKPPGTWMRFSHTSVPYGADAEELLRTQALGGLLEEAGRIQSLGTVYVPDEGRCMTFFRLVPQDFLRVLPGGMPKNVRDTLLKLYFADDGYHSARAIELAPEKVQLFAREYEALRPD